LVKTHNFLRMHGQQNIKFWCIYIKGYAGNICLLPVGKFPNTVSGLMQWALYTVEIRCDEVGLAGNPDKTRLVVFTEMLISP
jgi:hypothetical protein